MKVVCLFPSEITQFADQVLLRLISHLIKSILRVLQNLLKYFNGTAGVPQSLVLSKGFDLNLNDSESAILLFGSAILPYSSRCFRKIITTFY